jgi:beta-glucosidase
MGRAPAVTMPVPAGDASGFPRDFLWGSATAAHQVEGDNRASDWWEYEQQGRLPYRSGEACRHYARFERDFDLARDLGQNAHRCSIEWSRIEPAEGQWDDDALAHYREVIAALRARGIEPVVTLHHFTNPAWFLRRGGWARRDSVALFSRYVERVSAALGQSVTWWLTINEPTVYAMEAYVLGEWPPCRAGAWRAAVTVLRNLARAHVAAYRILHRHRPDARVSFAHSAPVIEPCRHDRLADRLAATTRDAMLNREFFRLIGAHPREGHAANLDFVGLNYYTRNVVRSAGLGLGRLVGRACHEPHHGNDGAPGTMGWEVYPRGLLLTLRRFSRYGLPLVITENGIATDDEALRGEYLRQHLACVEQAIGEGLPVAGYFYWSLMDNFEWAHGFAPHFGLAAVDRATQARTLRPAAGVYAEWIRAHRDDPWPRQ